MPLIVYLIDDSVYWILSAKYEREGSTLKWRITHCNFSSMKLTLFWLSKEKGSLAQPNQRIFIFIGYILQI